MAETMFRHRVPKLVTVMENHTAYAKAFNLGQIALDQVVFRWRRMVLTVLLRRLWCTKNAIMSTYSLPEIGQVPGDCPHPIEARRKGGNRYGQYVHCVMCHKRIEYTKFASPLKGKKSQREAANLVRETQTGQPHDPPKFTKKDKAAAEAAVQNSQRRNQDMVQAMAQTMMSAPMTQLVEAIAASAQQSASSNETVTQILAMSIQQQQQASSVQQQTNATLNQTLNQLVGQQSEVLQAIRQQDGQDHKKQKGGQ